MITENEVLKMVSEMYEDDRGYVISRALRLLQSGAINLDDYEMDYRLPKILYYSALIDLAENQRRPLAKDDQKTAKNLLHF